METAVSLNTVEMTRRLCGRLCVMVVAQHTLHVTGNALRTHPGVKVSPCRILQVLPLPPRSHTSRGSSISPLTRCKGPVFRLHVLSQKAVLTLSRPSEASDKCKNNGGGRGCHIKQHICSCFRAGILPHLPSARIFCVSALH